MNKDFVRRMTHEALIILGVLALFTFMFRLWPLLILVIFCILLGAVRLMFLKAKASMVQQEEAVKEEPSRTPNERDVRELAYSVILTRISELVSSEYPTAKWVWEKPNSRKLIENGEDVCIILSGAGGYRRAKVKIQNLQVVALEYLTAKLPETPESVDDVDEEEDDTESEPVPVNYELLAFEWAEAHVIELNDRCNEAIGQGKKELILMSEELPTSESWGNICSELKRAGLEDVEVIEVGIKINLQQ